MRDTFRPYDYFSAVIDSEKAVIEDCLAYLDSGQCTNFNSEIGTIANSCTIISTCYYSMGKSIECLLEPIESAIAYAIKWSQASFLRSWYPMPLDMVGLCVLLDADEQIFESLASIFERKKLKDKRANVKDNLMENLLGYKLKNRDINTSHIINNGLPGLRQAIALKDTDKLQAEKVMKEYFDKISIMTLYGDMNDPMPHTYEKHYRGYWDFKGAAVSKLCGLDDSSYRDSIHYPVDLVEYHRQS